MKLENKVALITGGSRGLGRSVAEAFLDQGAKVAIAARNEKELLQTACKLSLKGTCLPFPADVSSQEEAGSLIKKVLENFESIDILVNAAAVIGPIGPFYQNKLEEWRRSFEIIFFGTVYPIYYVLPHYLEKKRGKIINFSGGGATRARENFSAYAAAKTAIVRLTEILASELKDFNIQVNAIAPGVVKTAMIEEIIKAGPARAGREFEELVLRKENEFDPPDLAAQLAVFLASDESHDLSGKIISARWDKWAEPEILKKMQEDKDFFVLRRIDGREFEKVKK